MERPDEKLEKMLNEFGLYTVNASEVEPKEGANVLGVEVEIPIASEGEFSKPDFGIRSVSKRGVVINFGRWKVDVRDGNRYLSFTALSQMPNGVTPCIPTYGGKIGYSFIDLCWSVGVEARPENPPEFFAPVRPGTEYVDIGWYLPSRFVDHLIDALGKVNDTFFSGALQDAIIYGIVNGVNKIYG